MKTENQNPNPEQTVKTRIYNLIILDKSGSMTRIQTAAYQGCNEVLGGIRAAAEKHADDQEQFVSLLLFDTESMPYIHKCTPAAEATDLRQEDYDPCACTPLLDAMGISLTELEREVDKQEEATAMVTVITDGYENASTEYTYPQIQQLVGRLKQKGWNFAFMGANQDVAKVCVDLNINVGNARAFSFDDAGMRESWRKDREAKERFYDRIHCMKSSFAGKSRAEKQADFCAMNASINYFADDEAMEKAHPATPDRITPDTITTLNPGEIFVFGSNIQGHHNGSAAALACHQFGAVYGQAEGLQGSSYAIPTVGVRMTEITAAVNRFTAFAHAHPELKFLVTAVGCGSAGWPVELIAPLFRQASTLRNVTLPASFWQALSRH